MVSLRYSIAFPNGLSLTVTRETVTNNNMSKCHSHDSVELYFLTDGVRHLFVGGSFFLIRAGDIILIPAGVEHRTIDADGEAYTKLICMLPPAILPSSVASLSDVRIVRPEGRLRDALYSGIASVSDGTDTARLSAIMKMLDAALTLPESRERVCTLPLGRMSEILAYVEAHYCERLTLSALSERFYISEFYLCRLFKEYAGHPPLAYVTRLRVEHAKRLLATTDLHVDRVAALSGFGSVSSFSKALRSAVGSSAREYRAACRAGRT